jgi:hypothetical protein
MDKKQVQSILQDALEEKIPSSEVNLWRAVKTSLVAGTNKQQGANMNTTQPRRISRVAYATLTILALLALAFITPQGRAFAQSIIQLFTRAQSESFELEEPITQTDPSAPTAMPPAPLISVAEAETLAGFDLAELPSVPQGFEYLGTRMYGTSVSIEYAVPGGGGNLILMQSQSGFLESDWAQVPAEAIVPVKVGEVDAEYAQGTFVVMAGEASARWNSDAPILRLRWVKDSIWFELTKYGDVASIEYLDMEGLIKLAESLK